MAVPLDYTPVLWLRASDLSGSDSSQITTWADQSGNANDATGAAQSSAKPLLRTTAGPTGGKAVQFQNDGYFTLTNLMSGATAGEIFLVVKSDGFNCGSWAFGADGGNSDESHYPFGGSVYESFGKATGDRTGPITPSVSITSAFRKYNVWSASNDWQANLDGTSQATDASNTVTWTSNPRIGMGRKGSANDLAYQGHIVEVLLFTRKLTTTERTNVNNYLDGQYFGAAYVSPAVLAGTTTFFAPTVSTGVTLSPAVLSGSTTFFTAVVFSPDAFILPSVLSGSTTFFTPTFTSSATAAPSVIVGTTTFGTAHIVIKPAVILGTTTFPTPLVGSVLITPTRISGSTTFFTPTLRVLVSGAIDLGGVGGDVDVTDDRDQAAFTATITYPEDGDAVVAGGITVYATGLAVDNSDVNIQVDVSEFETFIDAGPSEEILDSDISEAVGPGEVATLTLSGLVVDTTYWLRARSGHVDTGEWGDYTTVIAVYAAEAVGEGYLWLYASDVDNSLPHPHLWSANVDGDNVVMIGAGFGDPQGEFNGTARATYYLGQTSMTVVSWDRPAATGDASTDDRAIEFEGDADPEHDVVVAAIPPDPSIDGVGVYIEIEEP